MKFTRWYPVKEHELHLPDEPGLWQVKREALVDYPKGKSAMTFYGFSTESLKQEFFSPDDASQFFRYLTIPGKQAEWLCMQLLTHFESRFGTMPIGNSANNATS